MRSELARVVVAHERGEPREVCGPLRQLVHLAVGGHLQAMLDAPQEAVSRAQFARGTARHVAGANQHAQCTQRRGHPQCWIAATPHELQGLSQELDLTDAAFAQLHVVAGDARQRVHSVGQRAALVLVDAALHGVDVGDRGEVQASAPDEGADRLEECAAQRQVTSHRACLDHGSTLPVLAHAFVVGDRRRQRDSGRCHGWIGPQAQIGTEDVAVGVARLHERHETACDAGRKEAHRMAIGRVRVYWCSRVVEQHEVHIGGIIQFTGTELSHAEDP